MKLFDKICRLPPCLSLECVCEPAEWNETWPIICGALWALIVAAVHWIFLITFAPESCGGHGQQKHGASGLVQQLHVAKPASKASSSPPKAKTSRPIATSNCKIQGIDFTLFWWYFLCVAMSKFSSCLVELKSGKYLRAEPEWGIGLYWYWKLAKVHMWTI